MLLWVLLLLLFLTLVYIKRRPMSNFRFRELIRTLLGTVWHLKTRNDMLSLEKTVDGSGMHSCAFVLPSFVSFLYTFSHLGKECHFFFLNCNQREFAPFSYLCLKLTRQDTWRLDVKYSCIVVSVFSGILSCLTLSIDVTKYGTYCFQYVSVSMSFTLPAASCANSQEWTLNRSIPELRLVRWLYDHHRNTGATSCGPFCLDDILVLKNI